MRLLDSPALRAVQQAQLQYRMALQQWQHELNERRDSMLTDSEIVALLDVYSEAGR